MKILLVSVLSIIYAAGPDFSGRWTGTFKDADSGRDSPVYAILTQNGNKLTGTAGPGESHQLAIKSGAVDGNHLMFNVVMGSGGTIAFNVNLEGPELRGKMQLSEDGHTANATVILKRVP